MRRVQILAAVLGLLTAGGMILRGSSRPHEASVDQGASTRGWASAGLRNAAWRPEAVSANQAKSRARSLMAGLPLMFEPNQGQGGLDPADARERFVARGAGYTLALGDEGAIVSLSARTANKPNAQLRTEAFQMKLVGANRNAVLSGANLLPGKTNYLIGNDPAKWKRNVPQFARVRYENVYPGVNLVFYGNQGQMEYDFQVAPGADPKQAELEFDGAKRLELKDGALFVSGKDGSVRLDPPQVYQEIEGRHRTVQGKFVLLGENRAGFDIGEYDHSHELVIDPLLVFSTFYGGGGDELNNYVAVDLSFNVYLAGSTTTAPTTVPSLPGISSSSYQSTLNGTQNVYIAKITPPAGSNPAVLVYATYLGGNGTDYPVGIGVDGAGNPYVAGTTTSTNFPVSLNAYQSSATTPGNQHVFVSRLQSTGSNLAYSSYLSGSGTDIASGMTIDQQGFIYVTGSTTSTNAQDYAPGVEWPVIQLPYGQPFQNIPHAAAGVAQFFVSKVNTAAGGPSSIAYSTYFGGGNSNTNPPVVTGGGIAVDSNGNIYFTGTTNFIYLGQNGTSFADFPILNPYQPCLDVPAPTVIVNPASCTYTTSPTAPDAFVAKLNPNVSGGSTQLIWSSYIGGSDNDSSTGVALDPGAASVYVIGTTNSPDIGQSTVTLTTTAAYQRCLDTPLNPTTGTPCPTITSGATDAFLAKLGNLGVVTTTTQNLQMTYFSFLGGSANDQGSAIAVDASSGALLTGWTESTDFPVPNTGGGSIQGTYGGNRDAFLARLNTLATTQNTAGSWSSYYGGSGLDEGTSVAIDSNQNTYFAGDSTSTSASLNMRNPIAEDPSNNGGSDAYVAEIGTASSLAVSGILTLGTNQTYISAGTPATFTYTITNTGSDPAYNITVTDVLPQQSQTQVNVAFNSATASSGTCSGSSTSTSIVCTIPSLQPSAATTVVIAVTPSATPSGNSQTFTGGTVSVTSSNNITPVQTSVSAQMSDFSISVSPSTVTVPVAGASGLYQLQFTPHPVFTTSITLSCSGTPSGSTCQFTPTSVTLPSTGSTSAALQISTTAPPIITPASLLFTHNLYATLALIPILVWLAFGSAERRRRRIAGTLLMFAVFGCLMLLPSCNRTVTQPPVSGTPAGNYTIVINATAGTDTKSTSVQLQVP